jgi:hypothetical protein
MLARIAEFKHCRETGTKLQAPEKPKKPKQGAAEEDKEE